MLKVRLLDLADMRVDELTICGNNHREWHAYELDARGFGDGHCILLADENRIIELRFVGVLADVLGVVDRDPENLEAGLTVLVLERLE